MKKSLLTTIFLCLVGIVFVVQGAVALPQYKITDPYSSPSGFVGGPFYVDPWPVGGTDGFPTFCIELTETFSPGSSYYGSIENAAIFGGGGAVGDKDPVDDRTKVLYSYFLDNPGLDMDNYTAIQLAIWRIEQEVNDSYIGGGYNFQNIVGATIINLANQYYNNSSGTPKYDIMALNLWDKDYPNGGYESAHKKQSMLIPVPEPGILILLGIAMSAVGLAARRFKI